MTERVEDEDAERVTETEVPLSKEQIGVLMMPLNPGRVQSRRGGGGANLSYLAAYDVKATLIRVFGFGGFSAETIKTEILRNEPYQKDGKDLVRVTAMCTVRLTIHVTGAVYSESAVSMQSGPDHGEVTDFAVKTAESDALKRAATYLGTQFGLGLYDNGSTQDVVRTVLEPQQGALLAEYRAEAEAKQTEQAKELKARAQRAFSKGQENA